MKYAIPVMAAVGLALASSAYPGISNSSTVQLNQWTYKYNEGLAKAAATGRPIMLAFVNQGNCSYCSKWDQAVISNADGRWKAFLAANPMVLIWVDQAKASYYAGPSWDNLINGNGRWGRVTAYPEVVILSSSGGKRDQFIARGALGTGGSFIARVTTAIGGAVVTPPTDPVEPPPPPPPAGEFPAQGVGSYSGVVFDKEDGVTVRGVIQMAASSAGRITVKVLQGAVSSALRVSGVKSTATDGSFGFAYSPTGRAQDLRVQVDPRGFFTGTFNGLPISGRKTAAADMAPFAGYYTAALDIKGVSDTMKPVENQPKGVGYLTLTVNSRASVKYSGLLADGTKVSGTSALQVYDGADLAALGFQGGVAGRKYASFAVCTPLYRKRGAVAGLVWIDAGASAGLDDNRVYLTGSEWQYPGKSASWTGDQFTADFDGGGVSLIGAYYVKGQNLASRYAGMRVYADGQNVANVIASGSTIKTDTGLTPSVRASILTGLMTGKVSDPDTGASAAFKGVLVPALQVGGGFYHVKDNSSGLQVKRSYAVRIAE